MSVLQLELGKLPGDFGSTFPVQLLATHREALERVLVAARAVGVPDEVFEASEEWAMTPETLAHDLAAILVLRAERGAEARRTIADAFPELAEPGRLGTRRTPVVDLVASLCCEGEPTWCRGRPAELRRSALDVVLSGVHERLSKALAGRLKARGSTLEDLLQTTYLNFLRTYWSETPTRRFLGRSTIKTALEVAARFEGMALTKRRGREQELPGSGAADDEREFDVPDTSPAGDAESSWQVFLDCLARIRGAKRQLVCALRWKSEMRPGEIARRLGIGASAVSMHLAKAQGQMLPCLAEGGFPVESLAVDTETVGGAS